MSRLTPCKRPDFIRRLKKLGFDGPFAGTRHQFMVLATHRLTIPSNEEYSTGQVAFMLREVEQIIGRQVTVEEWNDLK